MAKIAVKLAGPSASSQVEKLDKKRRRLPTKFEVAIVAERVARETAERKVAALEAECVTWGQNEGKLHLEGDDGNDEDEFKDDQEEDIPPTQHALEVTPPATQHALAPKQSASLPRPTPDPSRDT
ncbi:uncharacterized protein A4U43_C06F10090 [Asparagus officinalis]|uniref:Uncharacterized protein n=1 Tax=Asparagus officinalis TaxID=4686 RepID=A0A5P1EKT4_ASPOF|nr:uncharacterized protein A4U43_C06F10090 [Asparagus officinalis]